MQALQKDFGAFGKDLLFFPCNVEARFEFGGKRSETKIAVAVGADFIGYGQIVLRGRQCICA